MHFFRRYLPALFFLSAQILAGNSGSQRLSLKTAINAPGALAIDSSGHLYVIEAQTDKVLRIDLGESTISTVAGTGNPTGFDCLPTENIAATKACLDYPRVLAVNSEGDVFIGDTGGFVRRVDVHTNIITTVYSGRSKITQEINGLAFDRSGNLLIAEGTKILELNLQTGTARPVVGGSKEVQNRSNGLDVATTLSFISGISVSKDDKVVIAEANSCSLRQLERNIDTISILVVTEKLAADGSCGRGVVGPVRTPSDPVIDANGDIYFIEGAYDVVLRLDAKTHMLSAIAGSEKRGYAGDGGPATKALLSNPSGLAIDAEGNLYISEYVNNRIRRVDGKTGIITTIAGNGLPHRVDVEM